MLFIHPLNCLRRCEIVIARCSIILAFSFVIFVDCPIVGVIINLIQTNYCIPGTRARRGARWSCVSDPCECVATGNDERRYVGASWRHGGRQHGEEARHVTPYIMEIRDTLKICLP
jgi:hypothetical protein